jgi:hypothetical protein
METFGAARGGKKINPMWGAVVGTGVGTVAAVGVRQFAGLDSKWYDYSEAIGLGAGVLSGLGLMLLAKGKKGRPAGTTAMAAAVLNNGIRQLETMMLEPKELTALKKAARLTQKAKEAIEKGAESSGGGGIRGVELEPTDVLQGNVQMGVVDVEEAQVLRGGFAEDRTDMPRLVGANLNAANAHIQGIGGPALSQYGQLYGSTHFGK